MLRRTKEYYIIKAGTVHGDRYDYSQVHYTKAKDKVDIICREHGVFHQSLLQHTVKKQGCPKCSNKRMSERRSWDYTTFSEAASKVHNGLYCYEDTFFKNTRSKINANCKTHGEFIIYASNHLQGAGCKKCSNERIGDFHSKTDLEFKKEVTLKFGDKFTYLSTYRRGNELIEIKCNSCNHNFKKIATYHLNSGRCPNCSLIKGWTKTQWLNYCADKEKTFLYLIQLSNDDESFYKVGITSKDVSTRVKRFTRLGYKLKIIEVLEANAGVIYDLEKEILKLNKELKYLPNISFGGRTECFTTSVELPTWNGDHFTYGGKIWK